VIKIDENIRKSFYFVSNNKNGSLTIIDALCNTILKEIEVGNRPYKLALKDDNTISVACDMSNTISLVNFISGEIKEIPIPNNGNIQIDTIGNKVYVSNTFEVNIYDIDLKELLGSIKGFSAIVDLKLNKEGSKLYVLDTLLKELRIYSTANYTLICSFKNIGVNSTYLLISEDDKTAYVSMQNYILKINIDSEIITSLILAKGSLIQSMILNGHTLYASNQGLNRIELIDSHTNKVYNTLHTSRPDPTGLFITADNNKLLVVNKSREGYGSLDIIDLKSNSLIGSILMNTINSQPYDVISLTLPYTYVPPIATPNIQASNHQTIIIAKKIFASYNENINYPNINISLPKDIDSSYTFTKINFEPGIIVPYSESRSRLSTTSGFSSIKFIIRVSYTIDYIKNNKNNIINGFFEKPIEVFLDIPKDRELQEFVLHIKTTTRLSNTPTIPHNVIIFGITSLMKLTVVGDAEIYITESKEVFGNDNFEEFSVFSSSIFPSDAFIPL